ncbi:MAG: hypothetical protein PHI27_12630 [Eubacteriales bacterium]|nr:hypothetical protein [Eubacteriales bacterium]MDD3883068.1 hypothetical protein [Eubacteriales bacterium]MDD4513619.1 hypothetical protein [Eubacteriales bacterium]
MITSEIRGNWRIDAPDGRGIVTPLTAEEIPEIALLYRETQIKKAEYPERLNPESPDSFRIRGGMFEVHTEKSLRALLEDEREIFWLARDEDGKLMGTFWCGIYDEKYRHPENMLMKPEFSDYPRRVIEDTDGGRCYYIKEVIICHERRIRRLAESMFLYSMLAFYKRGFRRVCGEVFRLREYSCGGEWVSADMTNENSLKMVLRTKAAEVGEFKVKRVSCDGFTADITALMLSWELPRAMDALKAELDKMGITTKEGKI